MRAARPFRRLSVLVRVHQPVFDPGALSGIRYGPARHSASPTGHLAAPSGDALRLLHYKHLRFERTRRRYRQLRTGLGARDLGNGWDASFAWSDEKFMRRWRELSAAFIDIDRDAAVFDLHVPLWWDPLRIGVAPSDLTTQPGRASFVGRELRQFRRILARPRPAVAAPARGYDAGIVDNRGKQ